MRFLLPCTNFIQNRNRKPMQIERIRSIVRPHQQRKIEHPKAVIYTRVSTSKQVDNTSLELQLQRCREYCRRNSLIIDKEFGGTYESAKSDSDRVEFQKMIKHAKDYKIQYIIAYSPDRFSRTGGSAMQLVAELSVKNNIKVRFATQDTNDDTSIGKFQRDLMLLLSNMDNELRKEKVTSGMKERMRKGYCMCKAPRGYSKSATPGIPVPNQEAEFIKVAFTMKEQGKTNLDIVQHLKAIGCSIDIKRLTEIFRNPFYCGYITHSLIDWELVPGKHEPIISEDTYLNVNNAKVTYNKQPQCEGDSRFPLKGFIVCNKCNTKWTGYTVKQKNIDYYKCNKIGCGCNRSAKQLHSQFEELLTTFKIPSIVIEPLKVQLKMTFDEMNKQKLANKKKLELRANEIADQIKAVKTRFGTGKINEDIYKVTIEQLTLEYNDAIQLVHKANGELSNHKEFVDFTVNLSQSIDQAWNFGDSDIKRRLQWLVFPDGIMYDKQTSNYRTNKVNGLFKLFGAISSTYKNNGEEQTCYSSPISCLVARTGIEPVSKV